MRIDNKEILLGYIATLPDSKCKDIYYLLTGIDNGLSVKKGLVELTDGQYNKLIYIWGKDKTDKCIELLNEWLEKKGEAITKKLSHYRQLLSWVERKYYQLYPANDKSIRFDSKIETAWQARKYISKVPEELRAYDSEVKYLVNRFGKEVLS